MISLTHDSIIALMQHAAALGVAISITADGAVTITPHDATQCNGEATRPMTSTERSRRHRMQRHATPCNADATGVEPEMQRDATKCNAMQRNATARSSPPLPLSPTPPIPHTPTPALLRACEADELPIDDPRPKPKPKRHPFRPPPLSEWLDYADTLTPAWGKADAERAWNFYESKGWKVGAQPMKNWQAACRNCHSRNNQSGAGNSTRTANPINDRWNV